MPREPIRMIQGRGKAVGSSFPTFDARTMESSQLLLPFNLHGTWGFRGSGFRLRLRVSARV